jgi:hypothetical protein
MPKKVTFVSSISGTEVDEADAFLIRVTGKGKLWVADCTEEEAKGIIAECKAAEAKPRGRKPKEK